VLMELPFAEIVDSCRRVGTPIRRIRAGCCARTSTGHATALATPAMNSRRLITGSPHRRSPTAFLGW
jgi:hypothetical protein